MTLLPKTCITH